MQLISTLLLLFWGSFLASGAPSSRLHLRGLSDDSPPACVIPDLPCEEGVVYMFLSNGNWAEITTRYVPAPTVLPSVQPSMAPTEMPSKSPTVEPTVKPSVEPSVTPSVNPSMNPTVTPSLKPTVVPTVKPSLQPSVEPSEEPSESPSAAPTLKPTVKPTLKPSLQPSVEPSEQPSEEPSMKPSVAPSVNPSMNPTVTPSLKPTVVPTVKPSLQPSVEPSEEPSESPSAAPTLKPTVKPTLKPSLQPSVEPSEQPSEEPSGEPTLKPSVEPSVQPSTLPTLVPSQKPTVNPTTSPSVTPSQTPSAAPTVVPTGTPTVVPTAPTPMPSLVPTLAPVPTVNIVFRVIGSGSNGYGGDGGQATSALVNSPRSVSVDTAGNVYVSDAGNGCVRKIDTSGIVTTFAGMCTTGTATHYTGNGGKATSAKFYDPSGIHADTNGVVYFSSYQDYRVLTVSTAGIVTTYTGTGTNMNTGNGGSRTLASLQLPWDIFVTSSGTMYITAYGGDHVRVISNTGIINQFAGTGVDGFAGDGGRATAAKFSFVAGVSGDTTGVVYICDLMNSRLRKVATNSIISTVTGTGSQVYNGENVPASSASMLVNDVAVDSTTGNLYIVDPTNNRIRNLAKATNKVTTFAGTGASGSTGDGGYATSATFSYLVSIYMRNTGQLYITDAGKVRVIQV